MNIARYPCCVSHCSIVQVLERLRRAFAVSIFRAGCTRTLLNPGGALTGAAPGSNAGGQKTRPPRRLGATLSACSPPLANFSPSRANGSSSTMSKGESSSALAATTAATAEAAELPIPDCSGMPFRTTRSRPPGAAAARHSAAAAMEAVFFFGSIESSEWGLPSGSSAATTATPAAGRCPRSGRSRAPTAPPPPSPGDGSRGRAGHPACSA